MLYITHLFITHLFITHLFITHLFITHLFITHLFITHLYAAPCLQTIQLSRRDEAVAQEKAAELAASAFEEKNRQLQELSAMLNRLEMSLAQKVGTQAPPAPLLCSANATQSQMTSRSASSHHVLTPTLPCPRRRTSSARPSGWWLSRRRL
jgi:hypothetical protein